MNNEEAKFILQGYRPNGADAADATFCAAIEQTKTDPLLGEWFAKQQAFDAAVSAKLAQVTPPAGLRAAILAGGRVTEGGKARVRWWNQPMWMAAAAGVAVLLTAGVALWPRQAVAFDEFAFEDAKLSMIHGHGDHGASTNALQWTLSQPVTKLGQNLPVDFANLRNTGCRKIKYQGHDVLEICFNRNGEWFHCYIARSTDFPSLARNAGLAIVDKGGAAIASWANNEQIVVVVSQAGRKSLEALL
ncbi:MAG TPA: hypothetical protein VIM71_15475 [Lacunisphaera sp.]